MTVFFMPLELGWIVGARMGLRVFMKGVVDRVVYTVGYTACRRQAPSASTPRFKIFGRCVPPARHSLASQVLGL